MTLSQVVDVSTQSNYMLKYNGPTFYEKYNWDDNNIYFAADDTDNQNQLFYAFHTPSQNKTTWMPRSFSLGSSLEHDDNVMSHFQYSASSGTCGPIGQDQPFPFSVQFRTHLPNYKTQGSMGTVDAIVVSYTYQSNPNSPTGPIYGQERFYFARTLPDQNGVSRGLGWIRWENYGDMGSDQWPEGNPSNLTPTQVVDFTSTSDQVPVQPLNQYSCGH